MIKEALKVSYGKKLTGIGLLISTVCIPLYAGQYTLAKLPSPNFQWQSSPFIDVGVGMGNISSNNAVSTTETTSMSNVNLGVSFATYRRLHFSGSIGIISGKDVLVKYTNTSTGSTDTSLKALSALNVMLGIQTDITKRFYATTSLGMLYQRVEGLNNQNSYQPAYKLGIGYRFNTNISAELSYFGSYADHITIKNNTNINGGLRYNAGLFSLRYSV